MEQNTERDLGTLLNLLVENNKNSQPIEQIKRDIKYIFNNFEKDLPQLKNKYFIEEIKNNIRNRSINDIIIFMMMINYKYFGYVPRKIQIISLLLLLNNDKKNGLIEEVKTGEGKSLIIMFLATIKALQGKKVDIVTSSPELAKRDSRQNQPFFEEFGLTCDYCHEDEDKKNDNFAYQNYNRDIVYGTVLSFAGDYLRTSFMGTKGRGKRIFDVVIIDEIDNICIDNIMDETQLLDSFKGYKFLEYFYLFIYYHLQSICREEARNNNILPEKNKNKIITKLLNRFNDFYDNNLYSKEILYPTHLDKFIQNRKKDWCNCAFDALFNYKKNKHYIIAYDEDYKFETIKPVDFSNTGTIENKSIWPGLHQFLEIKHGLRLTEENLNSCFISNLCFFRLYKEKYGLTGTVGSEKTQEALKNIYGLDVVFIPTFRQGQYQFNSQEDFLCEDNQQMFLQKLLMEINEKYNENRAILVIVKYINQVDIIYNILKNSNLFNLNDIIIYTRNDDPAQSIFLNTNIGPKTIILSTNLCGRGTDIKITNECERNGGLHVILTFKCDSERVEIQGLGRAARKGEKGSGKIMLTGKGTYENLSKNRESNENSKFNYLMEIFKKKTIFFQNLFSNFCNELDNMKTRGVTKKQIIDIKEKWGLFLVENDLIKLEEQEEIEELNSINSQNKSNTAKIKADIIKQGENNDFFRKIERNFENFKLEVFYNNKEYQYLNPFIVMSDMKEKSFEKAQSMCYYFSLGADYLLIFRKISEIKSKIYLSDLKFINDTFYTLKNKAEILRNQFYSYQQLIQRITFIGNYNCLLEQNKEKIKVLEDLINNAQNNINIIEKLISSKKEYIKSNAISLKLAQFECSEDIRKYFQDLGLFNLYTLELKESCQIF